MSEYTQEMYNRDCGEMVSEVSRIARDSGYTSVQMAVAMGEDKILSHMVRFQEDINPIAADLGIRTISLSDLFGFGIKLSVN